MPTGREARPSENTMSLIYALMRHLVVCVWHPIPEDARQHADEMISALVKLKDQLKEENNPNKLPSQKEQ